MRAAVVARRGEIHIEAMGNLAFEGAGSRTPMAADTICRIGSMTKPVVAACAMTLVEDGTLRLDNAVSGFTPGYFDDIGWGFGMSVRTRRTHLGPSPGVSYPWAASVGSYGWPGVYGTGWYNDPAEDMTTILMIQRAPAPAGLPILLDF